MNRILRFSSFLPQTSVLPLLSSLWTSTRSCALERPSLTNGRLDSGMLCVGRLRLLPNRRFCNRFSTSSEHGLNEGSDLSDKKCVPCNSKDIHAMSKESAMELLPKVKDWELISENDIPKLARAWKVKSFTKGLEFFQLVANVAESQGHHPDLHLVGWNNVKIEIWTHSVGGLTENDFILAAKINSLNVEQLLKKKK
ncbi:hypothetical protein LUZ60_008222 [Juncus effusus]|nr:hypothetical protein LUZ60_008222 [Juncus effusus]